MAVLQRMREPQAGQRFIVAPVEALLQRTPPGSAFVSAFMNISIGETLDRNALGSFACATGYSNVDRVDEPGELNILGEVIDMYPAGADAPVRIALGSGNEVTEIRRYDPLSQRSEADFPSVRLGPASELILKSKHGMREPGEEHRAPEIYGAMETVFDLLSHAAIAADPRARERAG